MYEPIQARAEKWEFVLFDDPQCVQAILPNCAPRTGEDRRARSRDHATGRRRLGSPIRGSSCGAVAEHVAEPCAFPGTVFGTYRDYRPVGQTRGRLRRTRATHSRKTHETVY